MIRTSTQVSDLIRLATIEGASASEHLAKVYDWKYEHLMTRAKALAGFGSAIVLATFLPAVQQNPDTTVNWPSLWIAWGGAAVFVALGITFFLRARTTLVEYIAAQALLSEMIEIRPFLRLYERRAR